MLWNYSLTPNFFFLPAFHIVGFTPASVSDQTSLEVQPKTQNSSEKVISPNQKPLLYVSQEDLIETGYESNKAPWTEEEDNKLQRLRNEEHLEWSQIADLMEGRNSKMCYSRHRRLENKTKQIWRNADDQLLIQLVGSMGEDWKNISQYFPNRTHKQIKEHYNNYLRDGINRDDWDLEQDMKLVNLLNEHGKNWKLIQSLFEGRTQNQIKNRYFGRLKRISDKKSAMREKAKLQKKKKIQ